MLAHGCDGGLLVESSVDMAKYRQLIDYAKKAKVCTRVESSRSDARVARGSSTVI